jgi:hypothetical protein
MSSTQDHGMCVIHFLRGACKALRIYAARRHRIMAALLIILMAYFSVLVEVVA